MQQSVETSPTRFGTSEEQPLAISISEPGSAFEADLGSPLQHTAQKFIH
jgi:hypothetical protein